MIFLLALAAAALAVFLLWQARRGQQSLGLPLGRVISSDTGGWGKVEKPLYDPELRLAGKPDYVVNHNGVSVPVEVKSHRAPAAPYDGHLFQLAAYCLLVERTTKVRPGVGILAYRDRTFAVDYTPELEARLLEMLEAMRRAERRGEPERSHETKGRCERCGYRSICNQRL